MDFTRDGLGIHMGFSRERHEKHMGKTWEEHSVLSWNRFTSCHVLGWVEQNALLKRVRPHDLLVIILFWCLPLDVKSQQSHVDASGNTNE